MFSAILGGIGWPMVGACAPVLAGMLVIVVTANLVGLEWRLTSQICKPGAIRPLADR